MMDSVAAEIDQKNQEVFPQPVPGKKPRKPRSDAGKPRGPRGGMSINDTTPAGLAKKCRKKAVKKSSKKTQRIRTISPSQNVIRPPFGPDSIIGMADEFNGKIRHALEEAAGSCSPWRDFGRSLSALCGHISRRTGIQEAGRRLAGAGRMIWSGNV